MEELTLGSLARIKENSQTGSGELAYVYDTYSDFDQAGKVGVCLITQSGNDTGGWSKEEQDMFLEVIGHTGWDYQFKNVIQLDRDFKDGIFTKIFTTKVTYG